DLLGDAEARRRYDLSLPGLDVARARDPRARAGSGRARPSGPSGPRGRAARPVRYEPPPGEVEADPTVLDLPRSSQRVHGAPRPRGILPDEHRVLRQARTLDVLLRHVADALPAARVLTGLRLDGRWGRHLDVDHAVLCGHRLALIGSVMVPEGTYTWDGADLRSRGRPVTPPLLGPAMMAWQQALPQVTVGGFMHVMTDRDARHAPVIRHARGANSPGTQADLLTAPPAPGLAFAREVALFLGTGPDPDLVDRRALGALVARLH
ncbi:molecular chaperone DnaJ, partial [Micrococcus luteus]